MEENGFAIQIMKSLYGLKQSGRSWYQRFKNEMLAMNFQNDDIAPCIFIKKMDKEFIIIAIYINNINLFGTNKIMQDTIDMLKRTFKMKDLEKTKFCLGL